MGCIGMLDMTGLLTAGGCADMLVVIEATGLG